MRVKTWKVLDLGDVAADAPTIDFTCPCGREATVPIRGRALAQMGVGIVFDTTEPGALPAVIQCRKCGRILTTEALPDVR
jgi:lysyl-tRNA synthetase class I